MPLKFMAYLTLVLIDVIVVNALAHPDQFGHWLGLVYKAALMGMLSQ